MRRTLSISSPAPASRITESAISATSSIFASRCRPPTTPRAPNAAREPRHAGARPNSTAVAAATSSEKRVLFTTGDAIGVSQFSMWTARKGFIDKNRAAMVDFMTDALRIVRWYLDPANHGQAMEICARLIKQPAERFGWVFTPQDNYRDPDMRPGPRGVAAQCRSHPRDGLHQVELRSTKSLISFFFQAEGGADILGISPTGVFQNEGGPVSATIPKPSKSRAAEDDIQSQREATNVGVHIG